LLEMWSSKKEGAKSYVPEMNYLIKNEGRALY
jgi:hypothetical protein